MLYLALIPRGKVDSSSCPIFPPLQEFIKRNGQFTVNVGLCEAGVPVLGVVGVPAAEEPRTYFAVKGEGAFVEVRSLFTWRVFCCCIVLFVSRKLGRFAVLTFDDR